VSKIIGIDLGTTNSAIAIMESSSPRVLENEEGGRTTPSVVCYTKNGERLVGDIARRQAVVNPDRTVYSVKRFMGRKFSDVKEESKKVPYGITSGKDDSCKIKIGSDTFSPEEISAQILLKIKRAAEKYTGAKVNEAVITVPAYFNDAQRQATKDAGKIAGLEVRRIINEPTAAALAYGLDKSEDQKVVVFDLGGGTFDVSVLDISDGVVEVLSTNGDTHLGGDDIDQILIDWMMDSFKEDSKMDVSSDNIVIQRLKEAAEKAKIELSSAQSTDITLPFLTADSTGPKHLNATLSRSKFEQMIESFVQRVMIPADKAVKDSGVSLSEIDEVILVGGSTRIPIVKEAVEKFFGKTPNSSVNPDEVVALGAAVQAGVFSGDVTDILLLDVTPLSLGIETMGGVMTNLISRNTTIPCTKSQVFSTAESNQTAVDINVFQGERKLAVENMSLGSFRLDGVPPAPRGVPQIEVSFDIDANGIVSVYAKDQATKKEQSITVSGVGTLSDDEVEKMVKEAKDNEDEDRAKLELIEKRNQLDSLVYQSTKFVDENRESLSSDLIDNLESSVEDARESLDADNINDLDRCIQSVQSALHELSSQMHEEVSDTEGVEPNDASNATDDNVVDVDFKDVVE